MLGLQSLVSLVLLGFVLASQASPIVIRDNLIRLPLAKKINVTSAAQILKEDQARAAGLVARLVPNAGGGHNVPAANSATFYSAQVNVGSPGIPYTLLIDTGSSNTFVGAGKPYIRTSTSIPTGNNVSVNYGSGSFSGIEYYDTVSLSPALTISNQSIGDALTSQGFDGIDGILGLGPVDLTLGTLSPAKNEPIPTPTDNLFSQRKIAAHEVAISFEPYEAVTAATSGELTFGGTDLTKYTGSITYTPITTTFPSSAYWGIDQTIRYGSTEILPQTAGIVDTGTTLLLIASDAYQAYVALTGAVLDDNTGLLRLTQDQFDNLESLFFEIHGTTFEFTPDAQIWPRALNVLIGGSPTDIYLIVGDLGDIGSGGLSFINGYTWLERFYSVYDTANKRVGIANTPYTHAVTNSIIPSV